MSDNIKWDCEICDREGNTERFCPDCDNRHGDEPNWRICSVCGETVRTWCFSCARKVYHREIPEADDMTGEERAAELKVRLSIIEIPVGIAMRRISELVGRSVWTHEIAFNREGLIEEALKRGSDEHADYSESAARAIECIPDEVNEKMVIMDEDGVKDIDEVIEPLDTSAFDDFLSEEEN